MTARDLIVQALQDLGILAPGDPLRNEDADFGLQKLARLIDNWNAERAAIYASQFQTFTLVPNLSPHTIGPTGATFTVAQRPVAIDGSNLVLTNVTPNVLTPIDVHTDPQWYQGLVTPDLKSSIPTDVFYDPAWPNGRLFFWPVPDTAWGVEFLTRIVLSQLALDSVISYPPGYRDALTLTLAEDMTAAFPMVSPITLERVSTNARKARGRIYGNNDRPPAITTVDSGMPGYGERSIFNYRTGR